MTRTKTRTRKTKPATTLRGITNNARKAIAGGLDATRSLVLGKAAEARDAAMAGAATARSRTLGAMTSLEKTFEHRVSQAIGRLGVPTASDVRALSRQVAQLQASVERLKRSRARA
jgi:poly(hydroxyalkanoate) granule-associated protein